MIIKPWPDFEQEPIYIKETLSSDFKIPPRILYHYTSFDTAKKIIEGHKLKFSCPTEFNDPFDMHEGLVDFSSNRRQIREWTKNNIKDSRKVRRAMEELSQKDSRVQNGFRESLQKVKKGSGVCCFSKLPNQVLMWSHYADKHKGVVLGFNILPYNTENFIVLEVNYLDKIEPLNFFSDRNQILQHWATSKSSIWKYEEEVRAIIRNRHFQTFFDFEKSCLKEIYFGCNTSNNRIEEINELLLKNNYDKLVRKRMIINDSTFNIKEINL